MRILLVSFSVISLFILAASNSYAQRQDGVLLDGVAAVVNDRIITFSDVFNYSAAAERSVQAAYSGNPAEIARRINQLRWDALNTLIERTLILDEFKRKQLHVPDYIIEAEIRRIITTEFGGNRVAFLKSLRAQGLTLDEFRKRHAEQLIVFHRSAQLIANEVFVSPSRIEQYYKANENKFKVDDRVHLRIIMLQKDGLTPEQVAAKRRMAEEIVQKLNTGTDFAGMAKLYSEQPQGKTGGDWGWVDRKTLRDELSEVAFKLGEKEHSDVIETKEAFYILYIEERKQAHVQSLAEVRDQIEKILKQEEHTRLQKQWGERMKKRAFIRLYPPFDNQQS